MTSRALAESAGDHGRRSQVSATAFDAFRVPLVDLGREEPAYSGIFCPEPDLYAEKHGVTAEFLENAEQYYEAHQGFAYWSSLIQRVGQHLDLAAPRFVVEVGCGFGNSTLPLLELLPNAHVLATDISPQLLAILKRLLDARGLADRCTPVSLDAHRDHFREGIADLVWGSAILHHLLEPGLLVRQAARLLKPGGAAVFFEPFEAGYALFRLLCLEISAEGRRRDVRSPSLDYIERLSAELAPQIKRHAFPGWSERDDKWMFPRSLLQEWASEAGCALTIFPVHDTERQFTKRLTYTLTAHAGCAVEDLPDWAWAIADRFDRDTFSPQLMRELLFEGCIIFEKT